MTWWLHPDWTKEPDPVPMCDICREHEAVTGVNGYGVCSKECADKAEEIPPQ